MLLTREETKAFSKNGASVPIYLHKKVRLSIFITFFIKILSSNIYWGIAAGASQEINEYYDNPYFPLGGPGFGPALGAILLMSLINRFNFKKIIMCFSLIEILSILALFYFKVGTVALISEGFIGVCDMISIILAPIWIDQYGIQLKKTLWFIVIQLAIPLGRGIGYLLNYFTHLWRNGLIVVVVLIIISFCLFASFPFLYFSSRIQIETDIDGKSEVMEKRDSKSVSIFHIRRSNSSLSQEDKTMRVELFNLLTNKIFICGVISKVFLVFIQTVIFYRISTYMSSVIVVENELLRTVFYLLILVIGPFGGVLLGVAITSSRLSYNKKHGGLCLLVLYALTCACGQGMIASKGNQMQFFLFVIGLFMFCSSSIPMLQGIVISSISTEAKGIGYSFSHIFSLLVGVGLSLYIYDNISKITQSASISSMDYACNSLFIGLFFAILLMIFNYTKRMAPEKENGMSRVKESNEDAKSHKSHISQIAEGLSQAYSTCVPVVEDTDVKLDKSIEREVNLDEMNERLTISKDEEGF